MTIIDIFDIWQKIMSEVNVQQGGNIRPQVDFENWYNSISDELFREYFSNYELSQKISDEIKQPFLKSVNVVVTPQPGRPWDLIQYPSDYEYFSNCRILRQRDEEICGCADKLPIIDGSGNYLQHLDPDYAAMKANFAGENLIERLVYLVESAKWESCLDHYTKKPTFDNPKITQFSGGFKIAPKGINVVVLDYLITPKRAKFGYTIGAGDIIIYNPLPYDPITQPTGSIQLQWSNIVENEFLTRLKKKYAIYVQDQSIYQMAENDKKTLV